jgi:AraC-like DNA-binding protein
MIMTFSASSTLNYSDVFYSFFTRDDYVCHDRAEAHFLTHLYSGEMLIVERGNEIAVRKGECAFIRRDHRVKFTKHPLGNEDFKCITLKLNRNFLRRYFRKYQSENVVSKGAISNPYSPQNTQPLTSSVVKLPKTPNLESLFLSMIPYFETDEEPQKEVIELKMQEGVLSLLNIDKAFFPTLFDFAEPWKIDILDFLNENYADDLTLEEIASYTGRSLATFKRDFKKISDLTPQKWLIRKRLQQAHELLTDSNKKITDVCFEVGFKNRSHFTTAYKKHYGVPPNKFV